MRAERCRVCDFPREATQRGSVCEFCYSSFTFVKRQKLGGHTIRDLDGCLSNGQTLREFVLRRTIDKRARCDRDRSARDARTLATLVAAELIRMQS